MKEEELKKEAKQSYLDNTAEMQWDAEGEFDYTRGYINAAEPREKRIAELEKENEKMKCCEICAYGGNDFGVCYSDKPCKNKNKWELAKWVK